MKLLNITIKTSAVFLLLILPALMWGQSNENSPYSRFGIGDIADNNFFYSQFMGGLGASYVSPYNINIVNPASLSYLQATSFDIGIQAKLASLEETGTFGQTSPYRWSGNLAYMSLAFPLQNKLNDLLDRKVRNINFGMGFTLKPVSTVAYNIASESFDDNIGLNRKTFQGNGGTYDFTWSNGVRYKNIAFGVNLGYLFGTVTNQRIVELLNFETSYSTLTEEDSDLRGFIWRAGLLYTLKLNEAEVAENPGTPEKKFVFGVHGNSKTNLNANFSSFQGSVLSLGGGIERDTFSFTENLESPGKLPSELGFGATYYSGNRLALGLNYTTTKWSDFESISVKDNLNDSQKLSFGGFIRPNVKYGGSYFSRVQYRFGAFYSQLPTDVIANQGTTITDMGLSFGFGFPFFYQRKISHANLGVSVGLKGRNTVIEERYFRLLFSFTFNDDEWFVKRKYN